MSDRGPAEPPSMGPEDPQSHLRIIPPDPVPDGDGDADVPAKAPPPATAGPGRPRVRVFSDEDPALMPLPAMGPGSGGSRLPDDEDDAAAAGDEATETRTMEMPLAGEGVAAPPTAEAGVDAEAQPEGDVEPDAEPAVPEGAEAAAAATDAEAPEPADTDAVADTAGDAGAAVMQAEAAEPTDTAGAGGAAGVAGVRLDRSDTGEIIKVSADQIAREPGAGDGAGDAVAAGPVVAPAPTAPEPAGAGQAQRRPSPVTKVATGIAFGVVALVFILLGRPAFAALAAVLIVWGAVEFYAALHQADAEAEEAPAEASAMSVLAHRPAAMLSVVAVAAMVGTTYFFGIEALGATTAAALVAVLLWFVPEAAASKRPRGVTLDALGIVHVGVAGCFAMLLLRLEHGFALLLVVAILTIVSDVAAYAWGTTVGHTPFFHSVSPNKSLEGFLGAVATTILAGLVVVGLHGWLYPSVPVLASWGQMFALALLVAVAATAGDLSESLFKRELGIKDVASFLPGHGGMLDRLDGMLFALPVAYVFLVAMGMADVG